MEATTTPKPTTQTPDQQTRREQLKALAAKLNLKTGNTSRGSVSDYHY